MPVLEDLPTLVCRDPGSRVFDIAPLMQFTQLQRLLSNAMKLNLHADLPISSTNDYQTTVE